MSRYSPFALAALVVAGCSSAKTGSVAVADADAGAARADGGVSAAPLRACDPIGPVTTSPVAVDGVIGAGRASDGTRYLLSRPSSRLRPDGFASAWVWTSDGVVLQSAAEEDVTSGHIHVGTKSFALDVDLGEDGGAASNLHLTRSGTSEELAPIADPLPTTGTSPPYAQLVHYDLVPSDPSARIVVTMSSLTGNWHRRVFRGIPAAMNEVKVVHEEASLGLPTFVTLKVVLDGVEHEMSLTGPAVPGVVVGQLDGVPLRGAPDDPPGTGMSYFCFDDAAP